MVAASCVINMAGCAQHALLLTAGKCLPGPPSLLPQPPTKQPSISVSNLPQQKVVSAFPHLPSPPFSLLPAAVPPHQQAHHLHSRAAAPARHCRPQRPAAWPGAPPTAGDARGAGGTRTRGVHCPHPVHRATPPVPLVTPQCARTQPQSAQCSALQVGCARGMGGWG